MKYIERKMNEAFELGYRYGLLRATQKMLESTKGMPDMALDPIKLPYPEQPEPRRSKD